MRCYQMYGGGGSKCSGSPIFIFLLKEIGFAPWPDIMLNQTLTYYWQEIFLLTQIAEPCFNDTIAYHCIWFFLCTVSFGVGVHLKLDAQSEWGGRISDVDGPGGLGGLENWTIFMGVIYVSSRILYVSDKLVIEGLPRTI